MEEFAKRYKENLKKVRSQNSSIFLAQALMQKHGVSKVEDAFYIEAKKLTIGEMK